MIPRLTPAELRTAVRLMAIYTEATAHILAEEQAAEALTVPTGDDMVAARCGDLLSTPEGRAEFGAYLDRLETTHGTDPAMGPYITRSRALLSASTPETASLGLLPPVVEAIEGGPSCR